MILAVSRRIQAANKRTKGLGEEKDSSKTRLSMVKKKASREMKWNKKRKKRDKK